MGNIRRLTPKEAILLVLYAPGPKGEREPVPGKTRMQKIMFLYEQEIVPLFGRPEELRDVSFGYEAFDYGPFSSDLLKHLDALEPLELVRFGEASDFDPLDPDPIFGDIAVELYVRETDDSYDASFSITDLGAEYVEECIRPELPEDLWQAVCRLKFGCLSVRLKALLRYVYGKYPEYAGKSKIREYVDGR